MAIDTREKRASVVGIITGAFSVGQTVNAAKDAQWRQEAGWGYPGIAAGPPADPVQRAKNDGWLTGVGRLMNP